MLDKLKASEIKYESIMYKLSLPETAKDNKEYTKLMREQKSMEPLIEKYREYASAENEALVLQEMIANEDDREFRKELEAEQYLMKDRLEAIKEELKIMLLPRDPDDSKSVVIEIRAGAGGEEAALFAADLYRMYTMYSDRRGLNSERISFNETELG